MAKKEEKPLTPEEAAAKRVEVAGLGTAIADYDVYVQARAHEIWSHHDTGHNLTIEEQLFCHSYVIDREPIAALRRIGQSGTPHALKTRAAKMLKNPEVQGCVEALAARMMKQLEVTAENVQRHVAAIAFFDPRDVMSFDQYGISMLHSRFWNAEQAATIKSIKSTQNGIEVSFYDRFAALQHLSKQLGVDPDEVDAAEAARIGGEAVMAKLISMFDRTMTDEAMLKRGFREMQPARIAELKKPDNA